MASEDENPQPKMAEPVKLCDHICMLPADHVEKGERHYYCYEIPSPRLVVERATPPAPDPDTAELIESAWRWRDEFANDLDGEIEENVTGLITSLTCEIERLAGLQAPPVDDDPIGWTNLYDDYGWGGLYSSADAATKAAPSGALEVAVPLYRRPGR